MAVISSASVFSSGSRPANGKAILVPRSFLFKRFGLDYVRLAGKDGTTTDVVVQTGRPESAGDGSIEILSGLAAGDRLVQP